jgi:hypothetical protein
MTVLAQINQEQDSTKLSGRLWADCAGLGLTELQRAGDWDVFYDNFLDLPTGKYTATQATAGTFALGDAHGGVALADCGSTTNRQGINVQLGGTAGEIFKPASNRTIWCEAYLKGVTISTGPEFFWGLAITDTTLIATSALSSQAIGFISLTDDNVLLGVTKDGSSSATASSIHTLVEDTWVKLGFKVINTSKVEFYVNGVLKNSITTYIPTTEMRPTLVCQTSGTVQSVIHLDWHAFAASR